MKTKLLLASAIVAIAGSASAKTSSDQGKYYVKANAGYAQTKYKIVDHNEGKNTELKAKKGKGFIGAIDFGYNLSSNVRSEVEFLFDDGLKAKVDGILTTKIKTMAGLVNFAYDFKSSTRITPFVMGGIGYAKNKIKFEVGNTKVGGKNKNNFIYQLGAGVALEVEKNVNVELGYRAINKNCGKYTVGSTTDGGTFKRKGNFDHVAMAALRVSF